MTSELDELRERIRRLDLDLIRLAGERIELARQVGEHKRRRNLPTVDYSQERTVLDRAREAAGKSGVDPKLVEELFARLIQASVTAQDEDNLRTAATGVGKSAVIVGGAGRMGRWFGRFLQTQGYMTSVLDPAGAPDETTLATNELRTADLIIGSAPPATIAELYREWSSAPPAGVVVDIASIKTPLIDPIRELQRSGCRVASIHPMFGPSIVLLRDADVVICDTSDAAATAAVEALFTPTTAHLVHLPLEDHDRIMADLLSLAHATAVAFALSLPEKEHPVRSTTFLALERLASAVVRESPDVYYEIQARNPHSAAALSRLSEAVDRITRAAAAGEGTEFRALFEEGRRKARPEDEAP